MIHHAYVPANGVMLHVASMGERGRPAVLLLHGFPEYWQAWHKLAKALAGAGYFVLMPDQRGYNLSDKPQSTYAYQLPELAGDMLALLDTYQIGRATVLGHDWGGAVAWWLAASQPGRVERLVILNAPHPKAMSAALRSGTSQKQKSAYMLYFRLPYVPELSLQAFDFALMRMALQKTSPRGTFSKGVLRDYKKAWRKPGALRGMLNWYRALGKHPLTFPAASVAAPTLIIWGEQDAFFVPQLAHWSLDYCVRGRLHTLAEASHWLHHEAPDRVQALILAFLAENEGSSTAAKTIPFPSDLS